MKNPHRALYLLLVALLPASVTARLGDTELQCEARYGKPVEAPSTTLTTAPYKRRYKFENWIIEATFVNRRVAKQSYMKNRTMARSGDTAALVAAILKAEVGDGTWHSRVPGSPKEYQVGIRPDAGCWRNTNGRSAYADMLGSIFVEEKGYSDSQIPKAAPAKIPKF